MKTDLLDLTGKNAIITGATGGIGTEIAKLFVAHGASVIGLSRHLKRTTNLPVDYRICDVSDYDMCEQLLKQLIAEYGHIDILVNCAGVTGDAMTKNMSSEQFDDVIAVNLKGVWNVTKFIGPHMQSNHGGSIINISSVVGIYGNVGQSNYAATKAGVIGMTLTWAREFSYKGGNVRVNAIAPGYTMTDMIKSVPEKLLEQFASQTMLGRLAKPEEIAAAVLFLASDMSSYVTGTTLNVNGGMRL